MLYVVLDKAMALDIGLSQETHRCVGGKMVVNEKELLMNPLVTGNDTKERASSVNGEVMSLSEVEQFIKNGGK